MASEKSNSLNSLNYFAEGMKHDLHDNFRDEKGWLSARNATTSSPLNDFNALSNEMSNRLVAEAPYTIIGCIYINDGEWAIFSTDDDNCEIGIFNDKELKYTPFVNSKDLKFKKTNLIKGVGRIKKYCHRTVYWDDDLNESRFLDFDDIPWRGKWVGKSDECKTFEYSYDKEYVGENKLAHQDYFHPNPELKLLDTKKIQLSPNTFKGLSFELNIGDIAGELPNGTYCVFGYYSYDGAQNRLTNYYSISNPQFVFTHENFGGSLEVEVKDVDTDFEEFTLVIEALINGNHACYVQGVYSTNTKKIQINKLDISKPALDIKETFINNPIPNRTAGIYKIGHELVRVRPTMNQKFNYQPYANNINVEWVSVKYPVNYYRNGGHNVGYMRDEVYSFFIRWVYNTGEKSELYHIPGRDKGVNENATCIKYKDTIKTSDGGVLYQHGQMAFWESNERYNDKNKQVWDNLCGKRIRHHKMPDNTVSPHYGKDCIYVLGVRFSNIQKPQKFIGFDNLGNPIREDIKDIIGYEILRGNRAGNKSIIAKGMINNMRYYYSYDITKNDSYSKEKIYYQNYPYNSTGIDKLISTRPTNSLILSKQQKSYVDENDNEFKNTPNIEKNILTFHSPDTQEGNASMAYTKRLSAKKLRTYMLMQGYMDDLQFIIPKGAPGQKVIRTNAMLVSIILGLGYSMFKMYGVKHSHIKTPEIEHGPALAGYGVVELGVGITSTGAPQAIEQNVGGVASQEFRAALDKIYELGGKLVGAAAGVDAQQTKNDLIEQMNIVTGAISGKGGTVVTESTSTPYKDVPTPLRILTGVPMFMTFWGEGINNTMDILYSFAPFRNYYLQQLSHGYYNEIKEQGDMNEYEIMTQSYLPSKSFITISDENKSFKVNNIYRHRSVFIETDKNINTSEDSIVLASDIYNSNSNKKYELNSYYASMYQPQPNQYGQINSVHPVIASHNIILNDSDGNPTEQDVIFGGDIFIGRYTEKNTFFPFSNWLNGQPDGEPFNYSKYPMINYPKYWLDSSRFNIHSIIEKLQDLISGEGASDFSPFELTNRFQDDSFKYKNEDYINTEVTFIENYKSKYPEYVKCDRLDNNIEKQDFQKLLDKFNAQRSCSCEYMYIEQIYKKIEWDNSIDINYYNNDVNGFVEETDEDENNKTIYKQFLIGDVFNDHELKSPDNLLYMDNNPFSYINCKFFNYNNNKTIDYYKDTSYDENSNQNDSDKLQVKKVWYTHPVKLSKDNYNKICQLKEDIDNASIKKAVGLGYINYLQYTAELYDNAYLEDECITCWARHRRKGDSEQYDGREPLQDVATNVWSDDFDGYYSNPSQDEMNEYTEEDKDGNLNLKKKYKDKWEDYNNSVSNGLWCGLSDNIPYTLHNSWFNPILLFFIQQNTSILLKYPSFVYDSNKRKYYMQINNNLLWDFTKARTYEGYNNHKHPDQIYKNSNQSDESNPLYNNFYYITDKDGCTYENIAELMEQIPEWAETLNFIPLSDEQYKNKEFQHEYKNNYLYLKEKGKINLKEFNDYIKELYNIDQDIDRSNYQYFTLNQVRTLLGVNNKTKRFKIKGKKDDNSKVRPWYVGNRQNGEWETGKIKFLKVERCKELIKCLDKSRGVLYRLAVKQPNKEYEKAVKKYNNKLKSYNKKFEKAQEGTRTALFANLKKAFREITPQGMYALDYVNYDPTLPKDSYMNHEKTKPSKLGLFVDNMYMYQFYSSVRDFFVESEQNIDLRQWGDYNEKRYYDSLIYSDLKTIFNTDDIAKEEYVNFDQDYIIGNLGQNQINFYQSSAYLEEMFDEAEAYLCRRVFPNRVIYSIPDVDTNITDGWRKYLAGNYREFNDEVMSCLQYGENGAMILFRNTSPVSISDSVKLNTTAQAQTVRVTQGSGELFNQDLRHMDNVDSIEYGSCQDSLSAINCPTGLYYVSQEQAKIFTFQKPAFSSLNIVDMSSYASGLNAWFKHYVPYMLTRDKKVFSDVPFELGDNPVAGVGFISSYDNATQILYISKKDYKIKDEYVDEIKYKGNGIFDYNGFDVELGDKNYFDDASFTLSYDTRLGKGGTFVSFHDWHPDLVMNSVDRIFTTKDNGIWRHNDSAYGDNAFCNFYGNDYPFEVEFPITSENMVSTLRSISYFLECFTYDKNEYDRFHKLFDNFDGAIIYNTEQVSGNLKLVHSKKEDPLMIPEYPKINDYGDKDSNIEILYSKEEQRYRFNEFWDITNDREKEVMMFNTEPNGYIREINPRYVDYSKSEFERKKFRHRINKVRLIKSKSGNVNLVFSLSMNHNLNSMR